VFDYRTLVRYPIIVALGDLLSIAEIQAEAMLRLVQTARHSGTRAKLADPESIFRSTGIMDSGFAAFGRAPE
jgi:hypothetical protein